MFRPCVERTFPPARQVAGLYFGSLNFEADELDHDR